MSTYYVLGDDQEELARLRLQHDLWREELLRLWNFSRLRLSDKILDLGCGPGFVSLEILNNVKSTVELTSVDISEKFLHYLNTQVKELRLKGLKFKTHKSSIEQLDLEEQNYETAVCRWLMIFVQDPEKAISRIHHHLAPGAEFVIQEYISYDSMDLVPDFKCMKPIVDAIFKSWKDQGGDPNRGKYLPQLLEKSGFRITHLEPVAKFARPIDPLWQWPESFYKSFLPKLQKSNYLTAKQVNDFFIEWEAAKETAGAFFVAPTVINIIAEKI